MIDELFDEIACGDAAAIIFLRLILAIAHTWDDLVDHDEVVSDHQVNQLMWYALIELPVNGFYRNHFVTLQPVMAQSIVNWQTATDMERNHGDLEVAYILRSSFVDIFGMVALLCGGRDHALAMAPKIRSAAHHEGLAGYRINLAAERAKRTGE